MAGRKLTGSVLKRRDGSVTISVPVAKGSSLRVNERFSEADAEAGERWRLAACTAVERGLPVPDAEPYRGINRKKDAEMIETFAEVALAWWEATFPPGGTRAGAQTALDRRGDIQNHLIPFFDPRLNKIGDMRAADVEEFLALKAGDQPPEQRKSHLQVVPDRNFTLQEAADSCGRTKSSIRKAYLAGRFPRAFKEKSTGGNGIVMVPAADLLAAGYSFKEDERPFGYSVRTSRNFLSTLRRIIIFARRHDLMTKDPSEGLSAAEPNERARRSSITRREEIRTVDLKTSARIAKQLHIHHQFTFWIVRATGLRISEAFGLRLEDVIHLDDTTFLRVEVQGGRMFNVWGEGDGGDIEKTAVNKDLKNKSSKRLLPLPAQLASLVDVYVAAFHADDAEPSSPLIVGSLGTGQSAFRTALSQASAAVGFDPEELGFHMNVHYFRHCLATDLASMKNGVARSAYLGHKIKANDGAAHMTEGYTHQRLDGSDPLVASTFLTKLIEEEIGQLIQPTPPSRLLGLHNRKRLDENAHVIGVLDEAGLLGPELGPNGEELLSPPEAAEILGFQPTYVEKIAREGRLERRRMKGPGRIEFWGVTAESVHAMVKERSNLWTIRQMCDKFDLDKMAVRHLLLRFAIRPADSQGGATGFYTAADVAVLEAHLAKVRSVEDRALSLSDAGRQLGVHRHTARRFVQSGQLEPDEEASEVAGVNMVTRSSVEALVASRRPQSQLQDKPEGFITFTEAKKRTGLGRTDLMTLSKEGVTIVRSVAYQFYFNETELEAWMSRQGHR